MLNIHERYECGVPVIIEGETGVGKTALIKMLSKLWNESLLHEWKKQRRILIESLSVAIGRVPAEISDTFQVMIMLQLYVVYYIYYQRTYTFVYEAIKSKF